MMRSGKVRLLCISEMAALVCIWQVNLISLKYQNDSFSVNIIIKSFKDYILKTMYKKVLNCLDKTIGNTVFPCLYFNLTEIHCIPISNSS